jgi:acetylornithine deacetylase/succinyl-diaminopimelate desuccinylase-like protein
MDHALFSELAGTLDGEWMRARLTEMIGIRSENPFHDQPEPGFREQEMGEYLADWLARLGLQVRVDDVLPGRPNVFGLLDGRAGDYTLMLAGHTDTARTTGYPAAYDVRYGNGRLYGRGACDMKAALAAYLAVAKALGDARVRLRGNLIICGNMDEEYQMYGSKAVGQRGPWADQGIIGEPTNLQICPANKGRVATYIRTRGRAAHSSVPEQGVNAIVRMAKVIDAFGDYQQELLGRPAHPLCGNGRFNMGLIRGGVQVNMVPDFCEMEVDRRTLPGETQGSVYRELHERIGRAAAAEPGFEYEISDPTWLVAANDIPEDAPIVRALRAAHVAIYGADPGVRAFVAGSDAPYMGFPTVVCGPGSIAQAHTTDEWVDMAEVVGAAQLYLYATLALLG